MFSEVIMKESKAECIANCLRTSLGSHVLYRSFGLEPVDGVNVPMRKDILVQLSTYYPDVTLNDVTVTRVDLNGQFDYNVDVKGE